MQTQHGQSLQGANDTKFCLTFSITITTKICNKLFVDQPQNNNYYALLEKTTAQQILEFPGSTREILSLIRSHWTLRPNDRRCPDTKEYPTKVPWSLMKRSTRLSSCPSEIMEKPAISSGPYSTIRRLNVHSETRSIWPILVRETRRS